MQEKVTTHDGGKRMPGKRIEFAGQKFGQLTVVKEVGKNQFSKWLWECKCECGGKRIVTSSDLRAMRVKSCGCATPTHRKQAITRERTPRSSLPRKPAVRPWLRLSEAERSILRVRIDQMLIHAEMKRGGVTVNG